MFAVPHLPPLFQTYKEGLRQHYKLPLYSTDVGLIYRNMAAAYMDMGRNHDAIEAYQVGVKPAGVNGWIADSAFSFLQGCLKHGKTRHDYCKQMISYLRSQ